MTDRKPATPPTPAPLTIRAAIVACLAWGALNLLSQLSLWLVQPGFKKALVTNNDKIGVGGKGYRDYSNPTTLDKDLHSILVSYSIRGVIGLFIIGFVAYGIKNARVWSRWVAVLLALLGSYIGLVTGVLGIASFTSKTLPALYTVLTGVTGLVALATLVLLFVNPSRQWFIANRPTPVAPVPGGAPGLRGMFMPRPRPGAAGTQQVVDVAPSEVSDEPEHQPASRGKAKVRTADPVSRPPSRGSGNRRPTSKSRKV